ncbi:MAG: T9SS type A sorting domain-containing protein [Bacteroidales bacterium]
MRKSLLLLFVLVILGSGYAQKVQKYVPVGSARIEVGDKYADQAGTVAVIPWNSNSDVAQVWALPSTGGTSGNTRLPGNTYKYQRTEYLITAAEMATSGFPSGYTIDAIGFLIATAGGTTQSGNFKVYLKNTTDVSYTLGSTWTTTGFTLASDIASWTVPITAGSYVVNFAGGAPFTYTGGGVYVAWEFSNPGTAGVTALGAYCNTTLTGGLYGSRSTTAMPTTLTVSDFRPATIFANNTLPPFVDVIGITNIYTTEKDPIPYGTPNKVGVRVANVSASAATFDLTVSVNSVPPVTYTQTGITLAATTGATYDFTGWIPTTLENVNITATATASPGETFLANNTKTIPVGVNNNLYSYCYSNTLQAAYGFTYPATGIWANKYHMTGAGTIPGANIYIYNAAAPNSGIGNAVYAVVLNSAGDIVAQSADLVLAAGNVNMINNFTFPTPPALLDEDFYVGLATPAGTAQWYPMGCMNEAPVRSGSFYEFDLTGGTPSASTLDVKYMIEAQVAGASLLAHDVGTLSLDMANVVTLGAYTPKATIKNYGSNTESFNVTMTIGAYTSTKFVSSLVSGASIQVTFDPWANSLGDYSVNVCTLLPGDLDATNDCKTQSVKVLNLNKQVYGYNSFVGSGTDPVGPTSFNLSTPGTLNSIANQSALPIANGGTWAMGTWYASITNTVAPYNLATINTTTGARTVIGDMGFSMNGLSYNPANGTMYGVTYNSVTSATDLYTIDLATGASTLVGSAAGVLLINLAINNAGVCYSVDLSSDNLGTVNLTTGAFTVVGPIGFNANYAQDMEFDRESGELFIAAYGTTGWLGWVNQATGATMKIGDFEGGAEVTGFAIPYVYIPPFTTVLGVVTGEESTCYDATNTITVAGTGTYTVDAGGSATFIAGQKVSFLPGTVISNGAYMHAYISSGSYCGGPVAKSVTTGVQQPTQPSLEQANFTIFPNPTNGNFTLVQKGDRQYGNVKVEIYSMRGDKVLTSQMIGEKTHEFMTSDLPVGLYFVKVVADDYTETIKLIRSR